MSTLVLVRINKIGGYNNYSFDAAWRGAVLPATYQGNGIYNLQFPYPPSTQDMCKGKTDFIYLDTEVDLLLTEYIS